MACGGVNVALCLCEDVQWCRAARWDMEQRSVGHSLVWTTSHCLPMLPVPAAPMFSDALANRCVKFTL